MEFTGLLKPEIVILPALRHEGSEHREPKAPLVLTRMLRPRRAIESLVRRYGSLPKTQPGGVFDQ